MPDDENPLINNLQFRPEVWGKYYWFFIHTVAHSYPKTPNDITKRKYYDLIQNMPLFIPDAKIGGQFSQLLDAYPVSPYLDSRDSFVRWTYFIHNKVNAEYGGKEEWTLLEAVAEYNRQYDAPIVLEKNRFHINRQTLLFFVILVLLVVIMFLLFKPLW